MPDLRPIGRANKSPAKTKPARGKDPATQARKTTAQVKAKHAPASPNKIAKKSTAPQPKSNASKAKTPQATPPKTKAPTKPALTGRKTPAQGKAHRAAALGQRAPKKPSPARATQNADATGLPPGWIQTTLGEINAPSRDRAHPQDEPDLPYVGLVEHVESQTMRLLGRGKTSDLKSSSVRFSEGDVLYGKMRSYLNKVWLAEFDGLCSVEFLVFKTVKKITRNR
jgi:hypothetical protein